MLLVSVALAAEGAVVCQATLHTPDGAVAVQAFGADFDHAKARTVQHAWAVAEFHQHAQLRAVLDGDADARAALPGETVDLDIETEFRAPGFWVATDTLRRSHRGLWAAYALVEDEDSGELLVERREVEVLYTDGDRALVRGALEPDDLVLASGAHRVVPGMRVALTGESEGR